MKRLLPHNPLVTIAEPGRASILALFLRSIFERTLARSGTMPRSAKQVLVEAGSMRVRISLGPTGVEIREAATADDPCQARIRGDLASLLDVALGRRRLSHFLSGRIEADLPIRLLLYLLRTLRA